MHTHSGTRTHKNKNNDRGIDATAADYLPLRLKTSEQTCIKINQMLFSKLTPPLFFNWLLRQHNSRSS